jgi:hypothetical protein
MKIFYLNIRFATLRMPAYLILITMLILASCIFPGKNHRSKKHPVNQFGYSPPPPPPPPLYEGAGISYSVTGKWTLVKSNVSDLSGAGFFQKLELTSDKTFNAWSPDTSSKGQYFYYDQIQRLVFQSDTIPSTKTEYMLKWNKSDMLLIRDKDSCEYRRQ